MMPACKKKILAVGCSMTQGHGLELEVNDPVLWVNRVFGTLGEIHNLARSGMNNQWIFHETVGAILRTKNDYDIIVVGWSAIPRYNFHVGLELYPTVSRLTNVDVCVNNHVTVGGSWLERIGCDLKIIHNDHWDIVDLVKYVNVLIALHETSPDKQIFFVNTLSPWCQGYFDRKQISLPSDLDQYTQGLLQVETRTDEEVLALYTMIHDHYEEYGGIRESHWLNLYDSLRSLRIDTVSKTDIHPGYQSQEKYAKYLGKTLKEKMNTN